MVNNFEDMFIRFAMIYGVCPSVLRDGRTDRRTDTVSQHIPRLCIRIAR